LIQVKIVFAERNKNTVTGSNKSPKEKYYHQSAESTVISRL
jgi:hypothetical protein